MGNSIEQTVGDLQEQETLDAVKAQLAQGADPLEILQTCQKGLDIVGQKYTDGIYYISDLMLAGEIFKQVSAILIPKLGSQSATTKGKVVIGTVKGDIHDIGKDLVVNMVTAAGYEVTDLGVDVPTERFVEALKETGATVVGLSGLLTLAFDAMKETVQGLKDAGLRDQVKVMIGGGMISEDICNYTGADGWGNNTQQAVNFCKEWIK
jgi:methanogenic corrinoid protein MtbC1